MFGELLRWAADRIDPPRPREHPPYPPRGLKSAFTGNEQLERDRREAAMRLMDTETLGYVLVVVRDEPAYHRQRLELHTAMLEPMWPPMKDTLARVVVEADRVYA